MKLKSYVCTPKIDAQVLQGRLFSSGPTISKSRGHNTEIFICGVGAKNAGFAKEQWVFRCRGEWWLRIVGNSSQRGQYIRRDGIWSTAVQKPTKKQREVLNAAVS